MKKILLLAIVFGSSTVFALDMSWFKETLDHLLALKTINLNELLSLAAIVSFGVALRFIVRYFVVQRLVHFFASLNFPYVEKLLKKLVTPLGNLAMALFWALLLPQLSLSKGVASVLLVSIRIFACLSLVMLVFRIIDVVSHYMLHKSQDKNALKEQLWPLFARALKIIVVILGALFVLYNLNVDVSSLIAGMTLSGLAFSLAAKDAVANIFGSLTIFTDNSLRVGDYIKVGQVEGTVLSVGFRAAQIKTPSHSIITIPNSRFTDSIVENLSRRSCRHISSELKLDGHTSSEQIKKLCEKIHQTLTSHPAVEQGSHFVSFYEYSESALKITIRFNLTTNDTQEELAYRHEIFTSILDLLHSLHIKLAQPKNGDFWMPPVQDTAAKYAGQR